MSQRPPASSKVALVLSGGGTRGAYEAGVVLGLMEVLGRRPQDGPLFSVLSGTSVGAINAVYLAANAQRGDHGIHALCTLWSSLKLSDHARFRLSSWTGSAGRALARLRLLEAGERGGRSLIDTRPLERIVDRSIDWAQLHANVDAGRVSALLVAALHVVSGRTTIFAELAPGAEFKGARDDRRVARFERVRLDHVLASAALPILFPTRRVGEHYYCDGGLRFNTPISPAIRAGAERLVVVSVRHERTAGEVAATELLASGSDGRDPSAVFLIGKLLNALLLDPVSYDLQVLDRLNQLMEALDGALTPEEMARVNEVLVGARGATYRRLHTLVFSPSQDLGQLAGRYVRTHLADVELNPLVKYMLARAAKQAPTQEADWASYLLFDGGFAAQLIEVGRQDAHAKEREIREFFRAS
ncbi:MAG TPA: patatin-like phospholipase family protein [Polyangiaceae bacterium]